MIIHTKATHRTYLLAIAFAFTLALGMTVAESKLHIPLSARSGSVYNALPEPKLHKAASTSSKSPRVFSRQSSSSKRKACRPGARGCVKKR